MKLRAFTGVAALLATAASAAALAAPAQAVHQTTVGLTTTNQLATFPVGQPQTATLSPITVGTPPVPLTNDLVGIDYRPRSNLLYGYAGDGTLYALRPTAVPPNPIAVQVNPTPAVDPTAGTAFGVDFNPVPDAIRVVSDTDENFRVSPDNGNIAGGMMDTALTPTSDVVAAAYTNSFQGTTVSTLFGVDAATDSLVRQGGVDGTPSPNGGVLTTIGPLGVDTTTNAGFDIETSFGGDTPLNTGYVSLTPVASPTASSFYTVNLTTGGVTQQGTGPIAGGVAIESVALPLTTSARFANAQTQTTESGNATVTVTRSGPGMSSPATLSYATAPGTAGTSDYTPTTGTLTFPANVARASFDIPITADTTVELAETFTVTLSAPSPSVNLPMANANATVRINDDDPFATAAPAPGTTCGKGTVQKDGKCVAKKKKKGKKKNKK